jgi:hypothetical protein
LSVLKVSLCEVGSMVTTKYRFIPGIWLLGPKGKAGRDDAPATEKKKQIFLAAALSCGVLQTRSFYDRRNQAVFAIYMAFVHLWTWSRYLQRLWC